MWFITGKVAPSDLSDIYIGVIFAFEPPITDGENNYQGAMWISKRLKLRGYLVVILFRA